MNDGDSSEGIFDPRLRLGVVSSVAASTVRVNLQDAGAASGSILRGERYGLGEVGEFILIESETTGLLGRLIEVRLPERERKTVDQESGQGVTVDAIAAIQLLGTISLENLQVTSGVSAYPRLGDRVYSAPASFLSAIPLRMERVDTPPQVTLAIGKVRGASDAIVTMTPERLFGRHCAILGATGGGKSYTVARLIEECQKHPCKAILLDATGEYREFKSNIIHRHLGTPFDLADKSDEASVPPSSFQEMDFIALFEPSGKVQGPKLRAAIRSLKLAELEPAEAQEGIIMKRGIPHKDIARLEYKHSEKLEDPRQHFDPANLVKQLVQECTRYNGDAPGEEDDWNFNFCLPMITRISGILSSQALAPVFSAKSESIDSVITNFLEADQRVLRVCMSGLMTDFSAKEIVTNSLGRNLLERARAGNFRERPVILFLDEAHAFIGKAFGSEEFRMRLDAFETIAKEGRKYGIYLCLATQRPRDLPEGVLSQMGTLVVHRLTNDRDRDVVERACGEIDRSASAFLPNLEPGEAAVVGVDFPIPLTIQIDEPVRPPRSSGANFQKLWEQPIKDRK